MIANQSVRALSVLVLCFLHYAAANDALETLQSAIEHGLSSIPIEEDRRIIEFWMNAGQTEDQPESNKCSVRSLDILQRQIESDAQSTRMTNVRRLYNFAEFDLLTSCGVKVAGMARQLTINPQLGRKLVVAVREFDLWFSRGTYGSLQTLAESVMYLLSIDRYISKEGFLNAWNKGPCPGMLQMVIDRDIVALWDYAKMLTETRVYPIELGDEVDLAVIGAASIVRYCDYFRSEHALIEVWKTLQAGQSDQRLVYQKIRNQVALLRDRTFLSL